MSPHRRTSSMPTTSATLIAVSEKPPGVRCCCFSILRGRSNDAHVSLAAIGREFTKLYWNQTVVYHLRQASALSKEAEAVRRIRDVAA
jgi:hypothetical protein